MATIKLTPDFREFLRLCNAAKIEYLVVGGYAVGLHGVPRPTKDLDIWIAIDGENLDRTVNVLEAFGFAPGQISTDMFRGKESMFRMGVPPNRLELFTELLGVSFQECYQRRKQTQIDGLDVSVVALEDLLASKRAAGRPQDIADVAKLTKTHHLKPPPS